LGSTAQLRPAAMLNLLGDVWPADFQGQPDWAAVHAIPHVKLHLYGKHTARHGRKMGHLTAVGETVEEAVRVVAQAEGVIGNWELVIS
jgi:5-(carboxyamino)imidazole ribonucleotide synthase